ncbi:MAG: HupE/UreJ family protein [Gammaproteobacteria bacterium]|nr:HupE/UreJ family protein [Gammaproteobacteria bacterium]
MSVYALGGGNSNLPMQSLLALLLLTPCYLVLALRQVRPDMLHMGMTSVFGLVHGIGFASVLQVIGLPQGQRGWALAGFNLGVEAGQLLLLLVFALLIRFASENSRGIAASGW